VKGKFGCVGSDRFRMPNVIRRGGSNLFRKGCPRKGVAEIELKLGGDQSSVPPAVSDGFRGKQ